MEMDENYNQDKKLFLRKFCCDTFENNKFYHNLPRMLYVPSIISSHIVTQYVGSWIHPWNKNVFASFDFSMLIQGTRPVLFTIYDFAQVYDGII